jgi:hypothetical protein
MSLKTFDPHRKDFVCKHEADAVPPIDPQADQWFQEAMALTSPVLWPDQRDYKRAVDLWTKAAERKHWKAMINLANAYAQGEGVERDTEHAVQIVEQAMKLGIPAAYDVMGTYYMDGVGVKQDASRAYAFWELAADMGSPSAQAYIGKAISGTYDDPKSGFWGNRPVALKMLECGVAQSNGKAAFELGVILNGEASRDYPRALRVLHDGVKFGSAESAAFLGVSFRAGEPLVNDVKDPGRGDRYSELGDALRRNPDLRLPNLDKVLPLPPAPLPKWDGNKQTLIDAAKAVVPKASTPAQPASHSVAQLSGRAHIPEGFTLPAKPLIAVPAQYETTAAPVTGYWLAQLTHPRSERHTQWNTQQVALRYEKDELFDRTRPGLVPEDGRLLFHYVGEPIPQAIPASANTHPRVAQGLAREATFAEPAIQCRGTRACPSTGIWQGTVSADHPQAATFNQWYRQAYVLQGQPFPDPRDVHLSVEPSQITWVWWNQANHLGFGKIPQVSVGDQALEA